MLLLYGECGRNANETVRRYLIRFPNRRQPTRGVILRLVNRAFRDGSLNPNRYNLGQNAPQNDENTINNVVNFFTDNPRSSIRDAERMLGVPRTRVWRILRQDGMHPFHFTVVQELLPHDYEARLQFCRWLIEKNEEDNEFIFNIMFSDEALFTRSGCFNSHNFHLWSHENPHATSIRSFQTRFSMNCWVGLWNNLLVI